MKKRGWHAKAKALIVLQGLKGRSVIEVCSGHQISQTQYNRWRNQFLTNIHQGFENNNG